MRMEEAESRITEVTAANYWHALYTRHQHEKSVAQTLSNKGHNIFLPLYATTHNWRNRPQKLLLPLFPCYVFVQGGMDRQTEIVSTLGMISIVKWSGLPAVVPAGQIGAIRRLVENPSRIEPYSNLQRGDRVKVISGSLQGLEGILIGIKGKYRLVVSMEMLAQAVAVEIDASCVQKSFNPSPAIRAHFYAASA